MDSRATAQAEIEAGNGMSATPEHERNLLNLFFFVALERDLGWKYVCNCLETLCRATRDPTYAQVSEYIRQLQLLAEWQRRGPSFEVLEALQRQKNSELWTGTENII